MKVLAFHRVADQLLRHSKGELISLSGRIQQTRWLRDGEEKTNLQIIADSVVSSKTVRPGGGRKKQESTSDPTTQFYNDTLTF